MLNHALRRTSGSNVHVIHADRVLGGPIALVELHRPPDAAVLDARAGCPVTWLCSAVLAVVSGEEAERGADTRSCVEPAAT